MPNRKDEPTKAEMLAALVTGHGEQSHAMATVQRSHRFPLHLFIQMENLAKHADVPVSLIINELIECGLDALRQELPEEVSQSVFRITRDQMDRPGAREERFDSKQYRSRAKRKTGRQAP
jgi:hypothetical protein